MARVGGVFARTNITDTTEFRDPSERPHPIESLPYIVAHELMHYQQAMAQGLEAYRSIFGERQSLLALSIREGSADFLASLIAGGTVYAETYKYGRLHEVELWRLFRQAMHQRDPGDRMFRRPSIAEWPQDLGYFMGYAITEEYYKRA